MEERIYIDPKEMYYDIPGPLLFRLQPSICISPFFCDSQ